MFKTRVGHGLFRKHLSKSRLHKERANLSFFFVLMFFAVFAIIVLTEVLLIDEKGRNQEVNVRKNYGANSKYGDRSDYEEQGEDYAYQNRKPNLSALLKNDALRKFFDKPDDNILIEEKFPKINENQTAKDGEWQTVSGIRSKFYVYSAFYDKRKGRHVRVIGATKTKGPDRVWCRLWYPILSGNKTLLTSFTVPAQFKMIRENWNLRYSAYFIICPLKRNMSAPTSVSIVAKLNNPPSNHLLVRNPEKEPNLITKNKTQDTLAVCVKPLHYYYDKAIEMLEFLELNKILGVEHITMYNHTIGPRVNCILEYYKEKGFLTLLPWQLNLKSQKEIRTEGLFAALNDCLYRAMYKYSYVAMIDLDEYIIPKYNDSVLDLLRWVKSRPRLKQAGAFSFQNAFFYLQWENDPFNEVSDEFDLKLITLSKTKRKVKLHPHKQRSKYICQPEYVVEAGNHFIWEFLPGHGNFNVPAEWAILHHYRVCEFGGDDCIKTASIRDRTAVRYRKRLVSKVKTVWNEIKSKCNLPDKKE